MVFEDDKGHLYVFNPVNDQVIDGHCWGVDACFCQLPPPDLSFYRFFVSPSSTGEHKLSCGIPVTPRSSSLPMGQACTCISITLLGSQGPGSIL